jgi:hypothetical protein
MVSASSQAEPQEQYAHTVTWYRRDSQNGMGMRTTRRGLMSRMRQSQKGDEGGLQRKTKANRCQDKPIHFDQVVAASLNIRLDTLFHNPNLYPLS